MPDGARSLDMTGGTHPVDIETAIAMIEAGEADDTLVVDLGEACLARADGRLGLKGLLQRLRGHRTLMALAGSNTGDSILSMRSGRPDVHPDVVAILDALNNRD